GDANISYCRNFPPRLMVGVDNYQQDNSSQAANNSGHIITGNAGYCPHCYSNNPDATEPYIDPITVDRNATGYLSANNNFADSAMSPATLLPPTFMGTGCAGVQMSFGSSGQCLARLPAAVNSQTVSASNMIVGYSGSIEATCQEGIWQLDTSTCN